MKGPIAPSWSCPVPPSPSPSPSPVFPSLGNRKGEAGEAGHACQANDVKCPSSPPSTPPNTNGPGQLRSRGSLGNPQTLFLLLELPPPRCHCRIVVSFLILRPFSVLCHIQVRWPPFSSRISTTATYWRTSKADPKLSPDSPTSPLCDLSKQSRWSRLVGLQESLRSWGRCVDMGIVVAGASGGIGQV